MKYIEVGGSVDAIFATRAASIERADQDNGDLTAEAQERLHHEGLWPLYESLRQTAYEAFVFGSRSK